MLSYPKFELGRDEVQTVLGAYLPFAEVVRIQPEPLSALPLSALPISTDPDDQKFLELAGTGNANVVVSGDRHLLSLAGRARFEIVAPGHFRNLIYD